MLGKFKFGTGPREVGESQGIDDIWGVLSELSVVQQKVIKHVLRAVYQVLAHWHLGLYQELTQLPLGMAGKRKQTG